MARARVVVGLTVVAMLAMTLPALGRDAAPVNDDFASATIVSELPFSETANNTAAEVELGEPQPSCGPTEGTLWYQFAPSSDINIVADTAGTFRSVLAVYRGANVSDLEEIECSGGATASRAEFRALAGEIYLLQVGSAAQRRGTFDIRIAPASWQERTLHEFDQTVETEERDVPILSFHGRRRSSNPSFYDMTIAVAGQSSRTVGVMTFGLVEREIKIELVKLPRKTRQVAVVVGYRYDASQYQCAVDSGEGSSCLVRAPIKDVKWLTEGDGQRAELFIKVFARDGDMILAERTISIPFAGQLTGLP